MTFEPQKQQLMFAALPDELSFSKDRRGPFYSEVQLFLKT